MTAPLRVVIVHERFTEWGGSEQVVAELHATWPDAPVYTTVVDRSVLRTTLQDADIRPSGLQRIYRGGTRYAHLLPLLPAAMRRLDLGTPDVVVVSHHAFANRVVVPVETRVVSYVHSPARWIWDPEKRAMEVGGTVGRAGLSLFAASQRRADVAAAQRADTLLANSTAVADRITRWWGRSSTVVPPPVDVEYFTPDGAEPRQDFFLLAGRLVPYKHPEVAVAAAQRAGVKLVVAGEGRMRKTLEDLAGDETTFLGPVTRHELRRLFRTCAALLFPGEEDFGIVPVEAQACGAPVLALARGGALDSVVSGVTGDLYRGEGPHVAALAEAIGAFDPDRYDPVLIRKHAEQFSAPAFRSRMRQIVDPTMCR